MNLVPWRRRRASRAAAGFTLAEVLAALAFMAIVIPVAVEGVRVANRAGVVAYRKAVAARVADRVLNESLLGGRAGLTARNGTVPEGQNVYRWTLRDQPWFEDAMRLVTVDVIYSVQGQEHAVQLSTLQGGTR